MRVFSMRFVGTPMMLSNSIKRQWMIMAEAIVLDPRNVDIYVNRGLSYSKRGQSHKAIADFTKAINLVPKLALAYVDRGDVYYNLGDRQKATEDFIKASILDPKCAPSLLPVSIRAVKSDSNLALDYNNEAVSALKSNNYRESIELLKKSLKASPGYVFARGNLAVAYNNMAKSIPFTRAVPFLEKSLELAPLDATTLKNLGAAQDALKQHHEHRFCTAEDLDLMNITALHLEPLDRYEFDYFVRSKSGTLCFYRHMQHISITDAFEKGPLVISMKSESDDELRVPVTIDGHQTFAYIDTGSTSVLVDQVCREIIRLRVFCR